MVTNPIVSVDLAVKGSLANNTKKAILIFPSMFFSLEMQRLYFGNGRIFTDDTLKAVEDRFNNPSIWIELGKSFKETLVGFPYFVYEVPFDSSDQLDNLVLATKNLLDTTLLFIWFIRDHNAYILLYGCYVDTDVSSQNWTLVCSYSKSEVIELALLCEQRTKTLCLAPGQH